MKSNSVMIAVAILAVSLAGLAPAETAAATTPPESSRVQGHLAGKLMRAFRQLNPADEQKQQVADILGEQREDFQAAAANLATARAELRAQIQDDTFDEAAVRAAYQKVAAAGAEMAVLRAKVTSQIRAILTPEQKVILAQLQTEVRDEIGERLGHARAGAKDWIESHKTR